MGGWQAYLYACTPDVERSVQEISESLFFVPGEKSVSTVSRILVVASPAIFYNQTPPAWLAEGEMGQWTAFLMRLKRTYHRYRIAQSFKDDEEQRLSDLFTFSWTPQRKNVHHGSKGNCTGERSIQYIAMIVDHPEEFTPTRIWGYCFFLASWWHVEHGGLSVHSSAVACGNDGFLFLGESESGKTTITQLSDMIGLAPLGDDLNFILSNGKNGYRLAAIPSVVRFPVRISMELPRLKGIFVLTQDKHDHLIPLSPLRIARRLFEGFNLQSPYIHQLPETLMEKAFHSICKISRQIPGYELHFRKSPDFWNVIYEQFPDRGG